MTWVSDYFMKIKFRESDEGTLICCSILVLYDLVFVFCVKFHFKSKFLQFFEMIFYLERDNSLRVHAIHSDFSPPDLDSLGVVCLVLVLLFKTGAVDPLFSKRTIGPSQCVKVIVS